MKALSSRRPGAKEIFVLTLLAASAVAYSFFGPDATPAPSSEPAVMFPEIEQALGRTSLPFIENEGQIGNDAVKFHVDTFAGDLFVTDSGLRYSMMRRAENGKRNGSDGDRTDEVEGVAFDERFLGRDGGAIVYEPHGEGRSDIPVSYFHGSDREDWKAGVKNYDGVSLGELWQGIDVGLRARGRNFEKIFTVAPDADPGEIVVGLDGIEGLSVRDDGTLNISTALGDVSMTEPVAYQTDVDGSRREVRVSYDLRGDDRYGFAVGEYDRGRPLVIDPLLAGTFLGSGGEELYSMVIDSEGSVFAAGATWSSDFPVKVGAYQETYGGGRPNFFISKFDADLTTFLASTYLGGTGGIYYGAHLELGPDDSVYIGGSSSADYPVTSGAYQETCTTVVAGEYYCPVVSKLDNGLENLLASTYMGNSAKSNAMTVDPSGRVFVAGTTKNASFPVTTGVTHNGSLSEGFISRLDGDLENLEASTFIGKANAYSVGVDPAGDVFVAGKASAEYLATSGAYDEENPLGNKYFISKFPADLTAPIASTFLGGTESVMVYGYTSMMQIDSSGNVYLTESTDDPDFPTTEDAYQKMIGGDVDLFISKLDNDLEHLLASTFLGGVNYEESEAALMIDADGNVFTTAYIYAYDVGSQDFPTTEGAYQEACDPNIYEAAGVSKLSSDLGTLLASTYLVTSDTDYIYPYALAADADGNVYVGGALSVGDAPNTDFPITDDAYQTVSDGGGGIFRFDNDLSGEAVVTVPVVATGSATDATSSSAVLNATLTDDGGETPTVTFSWGTESGTYPNTCSPVENDGDDYSCDLTGLTAGTAYYFIVSAENGAGTGTGDEVSFETAPEDSVPVAEPEDDDEDDDDDTSLGDDDCRPRKFSAWVTATGGVELSWKKPCDLIDEIKIERKAEGGSFERIATVDRSVRGYLDDGAGLLPGTYTYRVRGFRRASGKHSDYSSKKSVTIASVSYAGTDSDDDGDGDDRDDEGDEKETASATPVAAGPASYAPEPVDRPSSGTTDTALAEPSVLGEIVAAVAGFVRNSVNALVSVVFVGLVAGAAVIASPTGIPLFSTSPAPVHDFVSSLFRVFGFAGKKKREDGWGVVFDSETRRPIPGVPVSIMAESGHVLGISVTDSQGRYGFLPDPGSYTLSVSKRGYELETSNSRDILYGELYAGGPVAVEGDGLLGMSIALRSTTVDWRDFARRKVAAYTSAFSAVKRFAFLLFFFVGFAVNAVIAYLYPTTLNTVLFVTYLGMLAYYLFFGNRRRYGLITDSRTGKPVPFTMLSVHSPADPGSREAFAVSDVLGRYFMFVEDGEHLLRVAGRFLGGERFEKESRIRVRDGVIRDDLAV